jgi:hypothetical protein
LLPLGAGVVVFGAVTAFAATLSVNTTSLGAGNATVASCNTSASVSYTTAPSGAGTTKTYQVATAPITSNATCHGMSYKVSLLGAGNAVLAEQTGTLDTNGSDAPDLSGNHIAAQDVTGLAVVITG